MNNDLQKYLDGLVEDKDVAWWCLVGSRVTCSPPPMDTDQDILVLGLWNKDLGEPSLSDVLVDDDWELGGSEVIGNMFTSFKKDIGDTEYNIILTYNPQWAEVFLDATKDCKKNNYLLKHERTACFTQHFHAWEAKKAEEKYASIAAYKSYVKNAVIQNQANGVFDNGPYNNASTTSFWSSTTFSTTVGTSTNGGSEW